VAVIGHGLRKDPQAVERHVLYWNPQGRRKGGRHKRTWSRTVEEIGETLERSWSLAPKIRSAGDASWKPYAAEGLEGSKKTTP
jgi:hypothetical protein